MTEMTESDRKGIFVRDKQRTKDRETFRSRSFVQSYVHGLVHVNNPHHPPPAAAHTSTSTQPHRQ